MRLNPRVLLVLLLVGVMGIAIARAREVFLTSEAKTTEQTITSGSSTRVFWAYNFGELELKIPRPGPEWKDNPMLLRPQLLLLSCPPVSYPSRIHIELLADNKVAKGQGYQVRLMDPAAVAAQYANNSGVVPTTPLGTPGMQCFSFKKVLPAAAGGAAQPREEVHILKVGDLGFRVHLTIQPQIKARDEAGLRYALSNLTVKGFNVETKSNLPDEDVPTPASAPETKPDSFDIFSTNAVAPSTASATPSMSPEVPATSLTPDICLLDRTLVKRSTRVGSSGTTTTMTYNYGTFEVVVPTPLHWTASAAVTRPQLLQLFNGPSGSTSLVRLDLVGLKAQGQGEGTFLKLVPFTNAVENYSTNGEWTASTQTSPILGMASRSFQRGDASKGEPVEVIHLLDSSNMTFRLRVVLSPQLKEADAAALFGALSNLVIRVTAAK